jgi:hypothetical protein
MTSGSELVAETINQNPLDQSKSHEDETAFITGYIKEYCSDWVREIEPEYIYIGSHTHVAVATPSAPKAGA